MTQTLFLSIDLVIDTQLLWFPGCYEQGSIKSLHAVISTVHSILSWILSLTYWVHCFVFIFHIMECDRYHINLILMTLTNLSIGPQFLDKYLVIIHSRQAFVSWKDKFVSDYPFHGRYMVSIGWIVEWMWWWEEGSWMGV